ncbi:hypothetical protein Tco_1072137 [Tanacetum coccineum]
MDALIANKRLKSGKRFGFVRFNCIKNEEEFAKVLANIWIGSFHMFALVARFQRHGKTEAKNTEVMAKSFGHILVNIQKRWNKSLHITNNPMHLTYMEVALVKVKNVETMSNIYLILNDEGFDKVKIHYIGGFWLWLQLNSPTLPTIATPLRDRVLISGNPCNAFKNNTNLKSFFITTIPVSKNSYVDERMVWVKISGLPLCSWGSNAFIKVASLVGKFMFIENDNTGDIKDSDSYNSEADNKVEEDFDNEVKSVTEENLDKVQQEK